MSLQLLFGALIGAIIGYITNDIAIRMMFRPREPIFIMGRQLPFTPGMIPKGRERLARSIADTVSKELLSGEVMTAALLSPAMKERVAVALDLAFEQISLDGRTVREALPQTEETQIRIDALLTLVSTALSEKLLTSGFEHQASEIATEQLRQRLTHSPISPLRLIWDDRFNKSVAERIEQTLRELIENNAPTMIDNMLFDFATDLLDKRIADIYDELRPHTAAIREAVLSLYDKIITEKLSALLGTINIGSIIEDKLNAMDAREIENLIMRVMKRELRAIVWLGALLGALMGTLNALTSLFMR